MSTHPGVTSRPPASTVRLAGSSANDPTPVITPRFTVTSAVRPGAPVPSMTVPPRMTRSCMIGSPFGYCAPMLARPAPQRNAVMVPEAPCPYRGTVPSGRRDRVGDLGLGHHAVSPDRVHGHFGHPQALPQLEEGGHCLHVHHLGLAQEVDVEAGGHRPVS